MDMQPTRPNKHVIFLSIGILICIELLFRFNTIGLAGQNDIHPKTLGLMVPHTKFSNDCSQCHLPKTWAQMRPDFHFDHGKETGYPLVEAHAKISCTECHNDRGLIAAAHKQSCRGCHQDPHKATLGNNCRKCHSQENWSALEMPLADHAQTRFPLSGMHMSVACEQCHNKAPVGIFKGTPLDCFSCHQADYIKAPNHVSMNFPMQCEQCHNTSSFSGARFSHSFLQGATNCFACHQTEFIRAPQHQAFAFPHTCGTCYTTTTWLGGSFNHNFLGSSPDCYTCHQTDYLNAANHAGIRPLTCATTGCHSSTSNWNSH